MNSVLDGEAKRQYSMIILSNQLGRFKWSVDNLKQVANVFNSAPRPFPVSSADGESLQNKGLYNTTTL